jgi:uncharacterized delta-60 repeat protein
MAIQPDGAIVVVGSTSSESGYRDLSVMKFTASGLPDPAFGDGGHLNMDLGTLNDRGVDVSVLSSGDILVMASRTRVPDGECCRNSTALVRLHPDGTPDGSFGVGGVVTFRLTAHNSNGWEPLAMEVTSDGDIIALMGQAGTYGCPTIGRGGAYLVRRHGDGSLNRGFGLGGHVHVPSIDTFTGNMAIQGDGKILVGGEACATGAGPTEFGMVRLTVQGRMDGRFGDSGLVTTNLGGRGALGTAITLQRDGKIVLAGVVLGRGFGFTGSEIAAARYLP